VLVLGGCADNDGPAENFGERVDDAMDEARDRLDDAADEAREAADEIGEALRGDD
jgi:vacuolar-type H+-ATPase subunit H